MALTTLEKIPLGKPTVYASTYDSQCLFPIARTLNRSKIQLFQEPVPFKGWDIWNGYEVSWLNLKGKPVVATLVLQFACDTPNIVESKSLKLYLNSFNNSQFESIAVVKEILEQDLTVASGGVKGSVKVDLQPFREPFQGGVCLDELDVVCNVYNVRKDFLSTHAEVIEEAVYSHLLKANCLVTSQPDWGSVYIHYKGRKIPHENLLQYIVSFRNSDEFAETCAERMYQEITERCQPELLTVYLRFTRRGGLDINPYRTNNSAFVPDNKKLLRQ